MIAVCDMGPLHYLILIGCDHVLPQLFERVLTARHVVETEMNNPRTPEAVKRWAASPPAWLENREPKHVEDIPALGERGKRGDGDRAIISLALEERADVVIMDDRKARREAKKRGIEPICTLEVLDVAAERGLIEDFSERLRALEERASFYVGE